MKAIAFALWMIGCAALAIVRRDPRWFDLAPLALALRFHSVRGLANGLTALRVAGLASLPWLRVPDLALAAIVIALFILDGIDGAVARRRGEASELGAAFDMETDAFGVMMLSLLLWPRHGAWVLVAGFWRYAYALAIAVLPPLAEAPRSQFARVAFCILMLSFAGALLPLGPIATALAALGTATVTISFLISLPRSRAT
jgi:phosphatidylglycerophosphate synthase